MQEQACSSRTPRPMNNETQRHAVMSWCAATGAKHVFLGGTELAKSLVDLTEQGSAESLLTSESLSVLALIAPPHGWTLANLCAGLWDMLGYAGHDMISY